MGGELCEGNAPGPAGPRDELLDSESHHSAVIKVKLRSWKSHQPRTVGNRVSALSYLKCLPKDCVLVAGKEKKTEHKKILTSLRDRRTSCHSRWDTLRGTAYHLHSILVKNAEP